MNGKGMALTTVTEVHQLMDYFNTSLRFEIYLLSFPTSMHALGLLNYVVPKPTSHAMQLADTSLCHCWTSTVGSTVWAL